MKKTKAYNTFGSLLTFLCCLLLACGLLSCDMNDVVVSVEITSPTDGESFIVGDQIPFITTVTSENIVGGGIPNLTSIVWTSDKDGQFWAEDYTDGAETVIDFTFSTAALSENSHTITCKALNVNGQVGRDSLVIHVSSDDNDEGDDEGQNPGDKDDTASDYTFDTCYAMGDIEARAGEPTYLMEGTEGEQCSSKIYFKNNGTIPVIVYFFIEDTAHGIEKANSDGWTSMTVYPGEEDYYRFGSAWYSYPYDDRYVNTTYATAYYYDHTDPEWDSGCSWIYKRIMEEPYSMPPASITTVSVEGLNPCF